MRSSSEAQAVAVLPTGLGVSNAKLGMWVFLASEVMFFTGLIGAYIVLRLGAPSWPVATKVLNIPLTAFMTFMLIVSSLTMVQSLASIRQGNTRGLKRNLALTVLLGAAFLGLQAHEWTGLIHHGFTTRANLLGTSFFTLTGFHGAHVLGGVVTNLILTVLAFRGAFTREDHAPVELAGLYWHFVDVVWIILFTILYLI